MVFLRLYAIRTSFCRVCELIRLRSQLTAERTPVFVFRHNVLKGALMAVSRAGFTPEKIFSISFSEEGIDSGALQREFFDLCIKEIRTSPIFSGPDDKRNIAVHMPGNFINNFYYFKSMTYLLMYIYL